METTINYNLVKWGSLCVILVGWFIWSRLQPRKGWLSGLNQILPAFVALVALVIWALIF